MRRLGVADKDEQTSSSGGGKPMPISEFRYPFLAVAKKDLGDTPIGACSCSGGFGRAFEVACREGSIRAGLRVAPVILRVSRRVI